MERQKIKRGSGILLPISALPSPYGIGDLGRAARDFADFLAEAGQSFWQLLPLGPTGYGDSPYSPFSTFAGNPYFIDPEELVRRDLLTRRELSSFDFGADPRYADYGKLYRERWRMLELCAPRAWSLYGAEIAAFEEENRDWLPDYALFMALKRHFGMVSWQEWSDRGARLREGAALARYRQELAADIRLFSFVQYEFFREYDAFRAYVRSRGISLIGDLPIYVAPDSADVWAGQSQFQLDEEGRPTAVAGVPPDYFSEDGQLWGNPLYDYEAMAADGYNWWIRRFGGAARLCDILRIDHFRGFESYWSIPAGETTARRGHWVKGPGMALVGTLSEWFSGTPIIAEDLGIATPAVQELLEASGFPGMKVLEFAFSPDEPSPYLPHRYTPHCVCYAGTHDNAPLAQWLEEADGEELALARSYLGLEDGAELLWPLLRMGLRSVADVFIFQMQDALELGRESRMNEPGTALGNWRWRLLPGEAGQALAAKLKALCGMYGR